MKRLACIALAMTMVAASGSAQEATSIIVFGHVRSASGGPVARAEVWIEGSDRRVVSNDSGEYRLDGVPKGRQKVLVRRVGFRPDSKKLNLQSGEAKQVVFVLDEMLEELEAVLVTAQQNASGRLQEFWERRSSGFGVFITRAEIERRHPPRTADLFRQVMGVRVASGEGGGSTRLVTSRQSMGTSAFRRTMGSGACSMQYYVDGVFMTPGSFTVDDLTPDMIEAIEIFRGPSEIPARFRQRDTACGLVVIWTREPPQRRQKEPDGPAYLRSPRNL